MVFFSDTSAHADRQGSLLLSLGENTSGAGHTDHSNHPTTQWSGRPTAQAQCPLPAQYLWAAAHRRACVPCMLSCLGVKVPSPGVREAEGQGKRQGVTARWGLKDAWNEDAGRGTRTGYEVWYARDEWARHHKVLHPQLGRT